MITDTKKFPKKAKLITDGGFYQIIAVDRFEPLIRIPLRKRLTIATPETGVTDMTMNYFIEFSFSRVYRGYAEYKQLTIISPR